VADIPAGEMLQQALESGQAARIMTGAPVPPGADAVVRIEDTDFQYRGAGVEAPEMVQVYQPVSPGENVRPAGQDVRKGEQVMSANRRLRPQDAGFLSMLGVSQVPVRRKPLVAVFSTGDELLPVEAELTPGKIHDANTYTLIGLVEQSGAEPDNLGIIRDDPKAVRSALETAFRNRADLILSSAGVSVGALDFVRSVVEQNGSLSFWRVNMRPGKPIAFGQYREIPFIGLPGNPVSAFVGFEIFVRPALNKMLGLDTSPRFFRQAELADPVESDGRESYLRGIVSLQDGRLVARLTGHQGSGNLHSLVQANALLFIPSGVKYLPSGGQVRVMLLDDTLS
jgi:molybdopterin molybdotransferase